MMPSAMPPAALAAALAAVPEPVPAGHRRLRRLLTVAGGLVLVATACGFGGDWHWLLDLASHFRWYWMLAAAIGLAISLAVRARPAAIACGLALLGNAWAMLPFWLPAGGAESSGDAPPVSVIAVNVLRFNTETGPTLAYLRDRGADVVAVSEVSPEWATALESLAAVYPHRFVVPRLDSFGSAVLSRWPLVNPRLVTLGDADYPCLVAGVEHPAGGFMFVAVHPFPPMSADRSRRLVAHLEAVGRFVAAAHQPCIVAGDFNATPFSAGYRRFVATSGLRDTALGRGLQCTWNAHLFAPRIPIDHIFASAAAAVARREIGPDLGSDHFPIEAELFLPSAAR